jgi:hypothetical protein
VQVPRNHPAISLIIEGISPADWMMAASMRDALNILFDFDPGDRFAGITLPSEMAEWMEVLSGCAETEVDTTFVYGEIEVLKKSEDAIRSGNVSVLAVDSGLIPGQKKGSLNIAHHRVVLLSVDTVGPRNKF